VKGIRGLYTVAAVNPHLSLVLPARQGGDYIEASIAETVAALDGSIASFELIVVCNGERDGTLEAARRVQDPRVKVLVSPDGAGKGRAVTLGLEAAEGRLVGWLDSDLDVHPLVIVDAAARLGVGSLDAVVGSKRHPDSQVHYPLIRRVYSALFQALVRVLFRISVRDTQVGAKLFRREVLDVVTPLCLVDRYAFDLELLAVAAEFGFDRIDEVPIQLHYRFTGSGVNWREAVRVVRDTFAIAYRVRIQHLYVRRFAALQRTRMEKRVP
jgi:glycosyltransferase involved in cell wall biosynthesis